MLRNPTRHLAAIVCSVIPCLAVAWDAEPAGAGQFTTGLIPQGQAAAVGMRRAWATHVRLDRSRDRVRHVTVDAKSVFVLTERGTLHAIDALDGHTQWTARVGNSNYPSLGPSASEAHVAVVNGSTLYVLRREDGRPLWNESLSAIPSAGPLVSQESVFVPMFNGLLVGYPMDFPMEELEDRLLGRVPLMYSASGRALAPPILTPNTVAWATGSGYVYAAPIDSLEARFGFLTDAAIRASLAYHEPAIIAASLDGYVYAIDETTGDALWTFSAGGTVGQPPVAIQDAIYVVPDRGGMFRLAAESGLEQWRTGRVTRFLAASPKRVYASDALGRVLVLDAETGRMLGMMHTERLDWKPANTATDRLFLGTRSGVLQCLHETDLIEPVVYGAPQEAAEEETPDEAADGAEDEMPPEAAEPAPDDPFADP